MADGRMRQIHFMFFLAAERLACCFPQMIALTLDSSIACSEIGSPK